MSSMSHKNHYWPQFWNLVSLDISRIIGTDAHSIKELVHPIDFDNDTENLRFYMD